MDASKDLGILDRPFGFRFDDAVGNGLAGFLKNPNDVESGAGSSTCQHQLHWPWAEVATPGLRSAIDSQGVAAVRFGNEAHAFDPFDFSLQVDSSFARYRAMSRPCRSMGNSHLSFRSAFAEESALSRYQQPIQQIPRIRSE